MVPLGFLVIASQNSLNGVVPVVQTDLDGTWTVDMSIYADPSMLEMAEEAI